MLTPGRELFGTERDQGEIASAQYPSIQTDEVVIDDLPAFMDIRRANGPGEYTPAVMQNERKLADFIAQTMKMRRGVMEYEFSTVPDDMIKWGKRPIPKEVYSKPIGEIARALATLMWSTENCVAIQIAHGQGIAVGIYSGDPSEVEYAPYVKLLHRVMSQ
jgi:hypothetical protein